MTERYFHYGTCTRTVGPRGGVTILTEEWRRNGATKTWKREPERFSAPIKYGLRGYGYLTDTNADLFHTVEDCPIRATIGEQDNEPTEAQK